MRELAPDELHLEGKLQLETARNALIAADLNPIAASGLSAILNLHELTTDGVSQNGLSFYIQGLDAEQAKADIIQALGLIDDQAEGGEAAKGLLHLLT